MYNDKAIHHNFTSRKDSKHEKSANDRKVVLRMIATNMINVVDLTPSLLAFIAILIDVNILPFTPQSYALYVLPIAALVYPTLYTFSTTDFQAKMMAVKMKICN